MELTNVKDELRFVITGGELSVMICGELQMQMLSVDNLDFLEQVHLQVGVIIYLSTFYFTYKEPLLAQMLSLELVLEQSILTMCDALAQSKLY